MLVNSGQTQSIKLDRNSDKNANHDAVSTKIFCNGQYVVKLTHVLVS